MSIAWVKPACQSNFVFRSSRRPQWPRLNKCLAYSTFKIHPNIIFSLQFGVKPHTILLYPIYVSCTLTVHNACFKSLKYYVANPCSVWWVSPLWFWALQLCLCKNKLDVTTTEWLPWLNTSWRDSGYGSFTLVSKESPACIKDMEVPYCNFGLHL